MGNSAYLNDYGISISFFVWSKFDTGCTRQIVYTILNGIYLVTC